MTEDETSSIFTDDSGARKRIAVWTIRGLSCVLGLCVAAVGLSVVGHVTLPGLGEQFRLPASGHANTATADNGDAAAGTRTPARRSQLPAGSDPAMVVAPPASPPPAAMLRPTGAATPTTPPMAAPAATSTPRPSGKPTARPSTAADPAPAPGGAPTEPPGRAKKAGNAR